jgi:hypothetical protein
LYIKDAVSKGTETIKKKYQQVSKQKVHLIYKKPIKRGSDKKE